MPIFKFCDPAGSERLQEKIKHIYNREAARQKDQSRLRDFEELP